MTTATKWALTAGVLVLAVIVALLPLVGDHDDPAPAAGPDLGSARAKAQLAPCPEGGAGAPVPVAKLRGVSASCLGDGSTVQLGAALAGRDTLINVWATWCQPCQRELPVLDDYAARSGGADVLGVQVASSQADGLDLLDRLGVRLPSVHDGAGQRGPVRSALTVPQALPASYLVTADGSVRFIANPRVFTDVAQVDAAVANHGGFGE